MDVGYFEQELMRRKVRYEMAIQQRDTNKTELQSITKDLNLHLEALSLARKCLEDTAAKWSYIEQILTEGESETYGQPYLVRLEKVEDQGVLKGARFAIHKGKHKRDPKDRMGGGVQAVASFLFRVLICAFMGVPVLVIDEPLAQLPDARWKRLAAMAVETCKMINLQLIVITHSKPIGTAYWVEQKNEISTIRKVTYEEVERLRKDIDVDE